MLPFWRILSHFRFCMIMRGPRLCSHVLLFMLVMLYMLNWNMPLDMRILCSSSTKLYYYKRAKQRYMIKVKNKNESFHENAGKGLILK